MIEQLLKSPLKPGEYDELIRGTQQTAAHLNPHGWREWKDRYYSPSGYEQWNNIAGHYLTMATPLFMNSSESSGSAPCWYSGISSFAALLNDAPAIYVKRDLLDGLMATSVGPMSETPNNPFPAFFLFLPKDSLKTEDGATISTLLVTPETEVRKLLYRKLRTNPETAEEQIRLYERDGFTLAEGEDGVRVTGTSTNGHTYHAASLWRDGTDWRNISCGKLKSDVPSEILSFNDRMLLIAKNVILLLNHHYDSYVSEQHIRPPKAKRGFGLNSRDTLPIRWLGRDFVAKRERTTNRVGVSSEGTVAAHWRIGHWHTYWTGTGRTTKDVKWVQPCKVNWPD